jgi:hypothetical protein
VTPLEVLGNVARFTGLLVTIVGLWFTAGGMRVVVSGRIDERRRSAMSLKKALILLAVGLVLLCAGMWLVNWAQQVVIA